ncbi:ty3-gypsy retrotransposon protein [Tanacetum coccineum]
MVVTEEYQHWLYKLSRYDFEIQYRSGKKNNIADALSRMHDLLEDHELELIPAQLLRGGKAMEGYTLEDNHLLYQGRHFVPKTSKWILIVFQYFHGSMVGGMVGYLKHIKEWQARFIGWSIGIMLHSIRQSKQHLSRLRMVGIRLARFSMGRGHLAIAQQLMKTKADSHRKDVQFEVGEFVYLKLRPYRQQSVARRVNEKLAPKFFRPFEVLEKIGEPAEVLGVRKDSKGNHFVLVRWKDLPGYEATWEPFETMRQQFPNLHLEDKVVLQDGGIDTKWDKVYQRRNKQLKGALDHLEG